MPTIASIEPTVGPGVSDVLRRHNAERAFQSACAAARSSFPAMRALNTGLLDDPDEDDRNWVILEVSVPASYSRDELEKERLLFHEAMTAQVPLELNLLFGLSVSFLPE